MSQLATSGLALNDGMKAEAAGIKGLSDGYVALHDGIKALWDGAKAFATSLGGKVSK